MGTRNYSWSPPCTQRGEGVAGGLVGGGGADDAAGVARASVPVRCCCREWPGDPEGRRALGWRGTGSFVLFAYWTY